MRPLSKDKRIACLWFPDWPVQYRLAARSELARTVLLLVEKTRRGEFVAFRNHGAARRGIAAGMPLAEAQSLVSRRDTVYAWPMQPEADRKALEELALDCERYSPCVGLEEAESPQSLLLDITGIAHLFGGELSFARRLQDELAAKHFMVRIALADCIGAAWAAAHFLAGRVCAGTHAIPRKNDSRACKHAPYNLRSHNENYGAENPVIIPCGQWEILFDLPVEGLRLGESAAEKLHRLGIRTIRQVLSLPRSSLAARFGDEINRRLDQFLGERTELIVPCRPQPKFIVEHFLEEGTTRSEIIEYWWSLLVERLVGLLNEQQVGTRHLQCTFTTDQKTKHDITVRLCEATADARHLGDLLRLNLERFRLDAPLVGFRLEALETMHLEQPQQEMFGREKGDRHHLPERPAGGHHACMVVAQMVPVTFFPQLSSLLNRLSSRLGDQAVVRPRLLPNAIPEWAAEYIPVTEEGLHSQATINRTFKPFDRLPCLFPQPRPVEVVAVVPDGPPAVLFLNNIRFDIMQSWGPERIETGWWQGPTVRRDYFHVATTEGRRFWLFRQLSDGRWFLQGAIF